MDTRTNEQKTDDLIQQYFDELSLTKDSSTKEIEERLNKLKNIDPSLPSASSSYANAPELDEFDIVKNMISRALVEAAMEKRFGEENPEEQMDLELNEVFITNNNYHYSLINNYLFFTAYRVQEKFLTVN